MYYENVSVIYFINFSNKKKRINYFLAIVSVKLMCEVKFSVREVYFTHRCEFSMREVENSAWSKKPCVKYTLRT